MQVLTGTCAYYSTANHNECTLLYVSQHNSHHQTNSQFRFRLVLSWHCSLIKHSIPSSSMSAVDLNFLRLRTLFGHLRFFSQGFGDLSRHQSFLSSLRTLSPPPAPRITWKKLTSSFHLGTFQSPSHSFLPPSSQTCRILYVRPSTPNPPHVIHLPATGDHGFLRRTLLCALSLRSSNVASIILQGPLYGARRPPHQIGAMLPTVSDLADLGRATIEESLAIVQYLRNKHIKHMAITGISQGGLHAAMVSSLIPNLPVVMALAPSSAAPVFTEGVLSTAVDWEALGGYLHGCKRLNDVLSLTSIEHFPHRSDTKHVLIFATNDG